MTYVVLEKEKVGGRKNGMSKIKVLLYMAEVLSESNCLLLPDWR